MPIIYFHGLESFNSSKARILETELGHRVLNPQYTNESEFRASIEWAVDCIKETKDEPALVIGISLGAFAAFSVAQSTSAMAVMINPALRPCDTLRARGLHAWAEYTDTLVIDALTSAHDPRVKAYVNDDDELFGATFEEDLAKINVREVVRFPKGGHRAVNFSRDMVPRIVEDYRALTDAVAAIKASYDGR